MIGLARLQKDEGKAADQQRSRDQKESKKLAETLDNCQYCLDNMTKHLIIAVAKKVSTVLATTSHTHSYYQFTLHEYKVNASSLLLSVKRLNFGC